MPRESRLYSAIQPSNQWSWNEVLLNKISYFLEVLTWQNTKEGQSRNPRYKPTLFKPEFMRDMDRERQISRGIVAHDVDDIKEILARPRH